MNTQALEDRRLQARQIFDAKAKELQQLEQGISAIIFIKGGVI